MAANKTDVLYALLALDAYNRSKNPSQIGISAKDGKEISSQIGNATWVNSSDRMQANDPNSPLAGSTTSGFSASYYTLGAETVISYRGTDFDFSSFAGAYEFLKDFGTGWLTSFNVLNPDGFDPLLTGSNLLSYQPYYAKAFFEAVTGANDNLQPQRLAAC